MELVLMMALISLGLCASTLGALFGIGGGIIFIPVLTILFGLDATEAVAVSLVGIIATSTGAASFYVKNGTTNIRLGLLLEITTSIGAMAAALFAAYIENWIMLIVFCCVLSYSAAVMYFRKERAIENSEDGGALNFSYNDDKSGTVKRYTVKNIKTGILMCTGAGALASLTGVGAGTIKVPLMNIHMHVPIKVATATSSYMIGITAFSGAIVYFIHGDLLLDYAAAVAIGAFIGTFIGTSLSKKIDARPLRKYFSFLLVAVVIVTLLKVGGVL
jgi:uncharacterized membrane protein YfcA